MRDDYEMATINFRFESDWLCSIEKMKLHEGDKQYNSKADQWKAIKTSMSETEHTEIKKN